MGGVSFRRLPPVTHLTPVREWITRMPGYSQCKAQGSAHRPDMLGTSSKMNYQIFVHPQSTGAGAEWASHSDAELIALLRSSKGDTSRRITEELSDRGVI